MSAQWDHVAFVASDSEPTRAYEIKRRRADGHIGCSCTAYRFARSEHKTCKHVGAYRSALVGFDRQSTPRQTPRERVSVGAEVYTITRRSISFGAIG